MKLIVPAHPAPPWQCRGENKSEKLQGRGPLHMWNVLPAPHVPGEDGVCLSPSLGSVRVKSLGSGAHREQRKSDKIWSQRLSPLDPTLAYPSSLDQGGGGNACTLILSSWSGQGQRELRKEGRGRRAVNPPLSNWDEAACESDFPLADCNNTILWNVLGASNCRLLVSIKPWDSLPSLKPTRPSRSICFELKLNLMRCKLICIWQNAISCF